MKPPTRNAPETEKDEVPMNFPKPSAIIFDIETLAQDEDKLLALAPAFEPDSRLKDPEKIKENIAKQKQKYLERAALDWKTANIVLIGVSDGANFAPITGTETEVITQFFNILTNSIRNGIYTGGHNVKGFDLPMLINRARVLRIPLPDLLITFRTGRPSWHPVIFDTLEIFSFGDKQRIEGNGVEDICRALGLPGKLGAGDQFASYWRDDRPKAIEYNKRDCEMEVEIAKICGFQFAGTK